MTLGFKENKYDKRFDVLIQIWFLVRGFSVILKYFKIIGLYLFFVVINSIT